MEELKGIQLRPIADDFVMSNRKQVNSAMWLLHEVLKFPYPKALIKAIVKYFELMTKLIGYAVIALSTHSGVMGLGLGCFVHVALLK